MARGAAAQSLHDDLEKDKAGGAVVAHDAETGERLWITYTVPAPGEPGYETWTEREIPPLGGLTWGTISYDPELKFIYLGIDRFDV